MKKYLTVREAAEMFGVSPQTVYSWVDRGLLDAMRLGRTIRVLPPQDRERNRDELASAFVRMADSPSGLEAALERLETALQALETAERERAELALKVDALEAAMAEA